MIDYQWLIKPTGHPFVDTGGYVIKTLWERGYPKDILQLIEKVANIYVYDWKAKLDPFFLNSTITHKAFKTGEEKLTRTLRFYKSLIDGSTNFEGICSITGRRTKLFPARRDNSILVGSLKFTNFHSFFSPGVWVSAEVLIRMFFVPLGSVKIGRYYAVIISNVQEFTEFIVRENVDNNLKGIALGNSEGVYELPYNYAGNALFHYVNLLLKERKVYDREAVFTLYHFSNFANEVYLQIYNLPAEVFKFYAYCSSHPQLEEYWRKFLRSHYRPVGEYKEAKFDFTQEVFVLKKKDTEQVITEAEYRVWRNRILDALLRGESLLKYFINWFRESKQYLPFKIIEAYSKIILKMKEQTINKIKQLAEFIVQIGQERGDIKRHLNALSQASRISDLRAYLLKLVRLNYEKGGEQPLITVEEYVNYLFSDDISWTEIRDLLLLAVYEQLHQHQIYVTLEDEEVTT